MRFFEGVKLFFYSPGTLYDSEDVQKSEANGFDCDLGLMIMCCFVLLLQLCI